MDGCLGTRRRVSTPTANCRSQSEPFRLRFRVCFPGVARRPEGDARIAFGEVARLVPVLSRRRDWEREDKAARRLLGRVLGARVSCARRTSDCVRRGCCSAGYVEHAGFAGRGLASEVAVTRRSGREEDIGPYGSAAKRRAPLAAQGLVGGDSVQAFHANSWCHLGVSAVADSRGVRLPFQAAQSRPSFGAGVCVRWGRGRRPDQRSPEAARIRRRQR